MINKKGLELVKEYLENNYNIQVEKEENDEEVFKIDFDSKVKDKKDGKKKKKKKDS